jgi:hypothetical protein
MVATLPLINSVSRVAVAAVIAAVLAGCRQETAPVGPPATIEAVGSTGLTGTVGTALSSPVEVKVTAIDGRPVAGVTVEFAVALGFGSTNPRIATTGSDGIASTTWVLGTVAGEQELSAYASNVEDPVTFIATAVAGPAAAASITPHVLRIDGSAQTGKLVPTAVDKYGNPTGGSVTVMARNPSVATADAAGTVQRVTSGFGTTYVVVTAGAFKDSALVVVQGPNDSPCAGMPGVVTSMAVGQVVTASFIDGTICVRGGGEYVVSPFFNSLQPDAFAAVDVIGFGVSAPSAWPPPLSGQSPFQSFVGASPGRDEAVHDRLRRTEHTQMNDRAAGARAWFGRRAPSAARSATMIPSTVTIGQILELNVNANDFCSNAEMRRGRVVAITEKAIVVADTGNPIGGFTDAEYRDIGLRFDAQIWTTNTENFGTPSDIDNNGRVVLFFTRAVNALTSRGSLSLVLGFFYSRDLLPLDSDEGACPGSNVGEMMYLLVPDPDGIVSNARSKTQVTSYNDGTMSHEFQHLINASRRLYVNTADAPTEERWLNEGLSHIAEELNFYTSSGRAPRQNLSVTTALTYPSYATYMKENVARAATYMARNAEQSPIGENDDDDDLSTRGATWLFLRYIADHTAAANEKAFWFNLVNSTTSGVANLDAAVHGDAKAYMWRWSLANLLDDRFATDAPYQHPSWVMPGFTSLTNRPVMQTLDNAVTKSITMRANGVSYFRFGVAGANGEAYVAITSNGAPVPSSMLLSLVRTK